MTNHQAVCNYALLHFRPYPETGEVVNVGVVVSCLHPLFIESQIERERIPERVRLMYPEQKSEQYRNATEAIHDEILRISKRIQDPKSCQIAFKELVRPRENTFRFGEVKTVLTESPHELCEDLFRRYVQMIREEAAV